jgi:dethiobiotin synthetase
MSAVFVTATGTGVGKTFVTAALIHQLRARGKRVRALKPVVTGFNNSTKGESDPAILLEALGEDVGPRTIASIAPFRYRAPLAPLMAARREGRELDFGGLVDFCRNESAKGGVLLIEGVGGVMVPLAGAKTVLDWIAALKCPAILVCGSYLGTLSHTLTALDVLVRRGVEVAGIVVSESAGVEVGLEETARVIGELTARPTFALPRLLGPKAWMRAPDLRGLMPG